MSVTLTEGLLLGIGGMVVAHGVWMVKVAGGYIERRLNAGEARFKAIEQSVDELDRRLTILETQHRERVNCHDQK